MNYVSFNLSSFLIFNLQPPASFLVTMEEYIREASQTDSMPNNRLVRTQLYNAVTYNRLVRTQLHRFGYSVCLCDLQEYRETKQKPEKPEEIVAEASENKVPDAKISEVKNTEEQEETVPKKEEIPPLISTEEPVDLLVCISNSLGTDEIFVHGSCLLLSCEIIVLIRIFFISVDRA